MSNVQMLMVVSTILKNISWDDYSQYMENIKCSKLPISQMLMVKHLDLTIKYMWTLIMNQLVGYIVKYCKLYHLC
jgi:hypothetical protein